MKREIKFRGMDIKGNWHYGLLSKPKVGDYKGKIFISNSGGMPFAYQIRPETLGQYTGLKDKNEKMIYEGDIFGCNYCDKDLFEIYYEEEGARFSRRLVKDKGCENVHCMHMTDFKSSEILGNIYESKHLLDNTDTKE